MSVVVNGGDEAEITTAYIEDGDGPAAFDLRLIGVGKHSSRFDEAPPRAGEKQTSPIVQRSAGLGKPGGVVAQDAAFDQSHGEDNMSTPWLVCQIPESAFSVSAAKFGLLNHSPQIPAGKCRELVRWETGGERGIRTPGRVLKPYNGLANRRFRPLSHLSRSGSRSESAATESARPDFTSMAFARRQKSTGTFLAKRCLVSVESLTHLHLFLPCSGAHRAAAGRLLSSHVQLAALNHVGHLLGRDIIDASAVKNPGSDFR